MVHELSDAQRPFGILRDRAPWPQSATGIGCTSSVSAFDGIFRNIRTWDLFRTSCSTDRSLRTDPSIRPPVPDFWCIHRIVLSNLSSCPAQRTSACSMHNQGRTKTQPEGEPRRLDRPPCTHGVVPAHKFRAS